jgi:hypothetical protein
MAPTEPGHLGWGLAGSATRRALFRSGESRVSRIQRPTLVNILSRRIQAFKTNVGSALLLAFGAGASYRPF